jgi:xanthine dehydrogenase YagS FAD-binding subunit
MREFSYYRPQTFVEAVALNTQHGRGARYFGGGTTLFDLMKLGIESPTAVIDVTRIEEASAIQEKHGQLHIGALAVMSDVAEHALVQRDFPVLSESLTKAASQQLRNMATVGGNLLQRTRCGYFRGGAEFACNKREPGSGCSAIEGLNRGHAVLGASASCVAVYPGDMAVALSALDAVIDALSSRGERSLPVHALYRPPGGTPDIEHVLEPDEVIVRVRVPRSAAARRSTYHKVRDRESYAFALASAAVAVELRANKVIDVRIALGGVATRPWRATQAEQSLLGRSLTRAAARDAATLAFQDARPLSHNAFKVPLGIETVVDALISVRGRS